MKSSCFLRHSLYTMLFTACFFAGMIGCGDEPDDTGNTGENQPEWSITPDTLIFPQGEDAVRSVAIENTGTEILELHEIAIVSTGEFSAEPFSSDGDISWELSHHINIDLQAGEILELNVVFEPTS